MSRSTAFLAAVVVGPVLGAVVGIGGASSAVTPAPANPTVGYTASDDGAFCQVTFTWSHPAYGTQVDHFEYAITSTQPDPRSDSWRDAEISTRALSAPPQTLPKGSTLWVSVHAETATNMPSGTVQTSFTC